MSPVELPHPERILAEINKLKQRQEQKRPYLDYMLDLQPDGFILTALFNLTQQQSHGPSLYHLTHKQLILDKFSQTYVENKLRRILIHAIEQGRPYDVILMPQPMGLSAISKVVVAYNQEILKLEQQYHLSIKRLKIHQFLTDIPSTKAIHYIRPLEQLSPDLRANIIIHCMDLGSIPSGVEKLKDAHINFYDPKQLHIIRQAFKQKLNPQSKPRKEKVASIMLSSSHGDLTIDYLKSLVQLPFQHFMIIGELGEKQSKELKEIQKRPDQHLHLCGYIEASELAKILQTSECIVMKGGGMSLMEVAALERPKDSIICLHQNQNPEGLSLSWEDGNNTWFKAYCRDSNQKVVYCNPGSLYAKLSSELSI